MPRVKLTAAQLARIQKRPRATRKPRVPSPQSEASLLRQVLGWLKARGVFHWRANAGGGLRGGRPVRGNPEGTPDVLAVLPVRAWPIPSLALPQTFGLLVAIECKAKGGRLRPAQRAWQTRAEAAGVLYLVVRSLEDLIGAFAREGVT